MIMNKFVKPILGYPKYCNLFIHFIVYPIITFFKVMLYHYPEEQLVLHIVPQSIFHIPQ